MKICVVGLGYVGLPLLVELAKTHDVCGFDINTKRIQDLQKGHDETNEVTAEDLAKTKATITNDPAIISECDFIIIAVPTPIDESNTPDLRILKGAFKTVGQNMKKGSIVISESTVYPGCTERDCMPILEKESGLKYMEDFKLGYSPERINPGDKKNRIDTVTKVVAGCDEETAKIAAEVYGAITKIHVAPTIKVAEAAKIIENTQRDINIALMNELKIIFDKADVNWKDVLEAAGTKWNFLKFSPGLVGGHCIGVDPYYLAQEAVRLGHHPQLILAGRRINDDMAKYEAIKVLEHYNAQGIQGKNILILGATFKPNVPDLRNSKIEDFANELKNFGFQIAIHDPHYDDEIFGFAKYDADKRYDFVIRAVPHDSLKDFKSDYNLF